MSRLYRTPSGTVLTTTPRYLRPGYHRGRDRSVRYVERVVDQQVHWRHLGGTHVYRTHTAPWARWWAGGGVYLGPELPTVHPLDLL